jgi:NADH dehydrogenase [ubiquinone] 1 alpha subcomplex assembly factor 5
MAADLFDQQTRAMRLARASRRGTDLFLHERAFEDMLDRLSLVNRRFDSALLIGGTNPRWRERLLSLVETVEVIEADALSTIEPDSYNLCVAVGALDTVDDLPTAMLTIRFALHADSLFIGTIPGGDTLPLLRAAMRAADEVTGAATPHVHPRIEPAGLSSLLTGAGFAMPVVDVDRVQVSYESFRDLVRDLRAMGATNILTARSRQALPRAAVAAAERHFASAAREGRSTETFELLHFAAWTPP